MDLIFLQTFQLSKILKLFQVPFIFKTWALLSSSKITQSGMWGDNTNGLSSTGLLRPTDSSSAIRRNYNYYYYYYYYYYY